MRKRKRLQIAKRAFLASDGAPTPGPPMLLDIDVEAFRAGFNRAPFLVRHHLADHPTLASERRRIVYYANAALRRKGLNPRPPGASAFRDLAKYYGFRARVGIKGLWR